MIAWRNKEGRILIQKEKQEVLSFEIKNPVSAECEYLYILLSSEGEILRLFYPLMSSEKENLYFVGYVVEESSFFSLYAVQNYDMKEDSIEISKTMEMDNLLMVDLKSIPFADKIDQVLQEYYDKNKASTEVLQKKENDDLMNLLNSLKEKKNIQLLWDVEESESTLVYSIIKDVTTGEIVWKSRAYYGDSKRTDEIESFLKMNLGENLRSFEINHSNDLCSLYYYGD